MVLKNTRMVLSNLLDDIKKFWFVALCVVQTVFILFYSYSIYNNLSKTIFLVIYSVLLLISTTTFILIVINYLKHKKSNVAFNRGKNIVKYLANLTMIVTNIFETIKYGSTDFNKILLIVSVVSLLIQILIEIVKVFAELYGEALKAAVTKDFELLEFLNKDKAPAKIISAIAKPLEKIAGIETEQTSEDKILEKHKKRYAKKQEELDELKLIKKQEQEEEGKLAVRKEVKRLKTAVAKILNTDTSTDTEAK